MRAPRFSSSSLAARAASAAVALAVGLAVASGGCARQKPERLPAACEASPDAWERALAAAPAPVRVDGTPISACFMPVSSSADIQLVGGTLLEVAIRTGERAQAGDERASLQLGYLLGAARRGAARTQGIHSEIVRRLEQELFTLDGGDAALRRGEAAGRRSG